MAIVLCPMSSCATLSDTPACISLLQKVWRRQCHVKSSTSASSMASSNQCRSASGPNGLPVPVMNTLGDLSEINFCRSKAATAVELSGIIRISPFFVLSRLRRRSFRSTCFQSRLNCSDFRIPVCSAISNSLRYCSGCVMVLITFRNRFSSSSDRNLILALFSFLAPINRAGFRSVQPIRMASR